MKIAIFLPNWIGDVAMATPALRAVRTRYSDAIITGIMRPYVADVLAGTTFLDDQLFYNPRGKVRSQKGWTFVRQLRAAKFDLVLLLPNSLHSGILAWLSGARRRVGFGRDGRSWLLTDAVKPNSKSVPHPVLNEYLRLTEQLGCLTNDWRLELAVTDENQQQLKNFWSSKNSVDVASGSDLSEYVCLNTGGAFGAAKNWPRESFAELANRIARELKKSVLVACGPSERDDARWIASNAQHSRVFSLADEQLSIGLTKAAVREAQLLITTDSGPRHFAAAFDTPVISLFGPTHIGWSENHFNKGEHLQLKMDCGPCQKRECPLKHHRCMRELTVDQVFAAVRRQLNPSTEIRKSA